MNNPRQKVLPKREGDFWSLFMLTSFSHLVDAKSNFKYLLICNEFTKGPDQRTKDNKDIHIITFTFTSPVQHPNKERALLAVICFVRNHLKLTKHVCNKILTITLYTCCYLMLSAAAFQAEDGKRSLPKGENGF